MSNKSKKICTTFVPGQDPIELVSYYEEFWDYYQFCELQTKQWFVENIQPDWVCIDAGANIGYHSILMARLATKGKVYSFEPTETIEFLKNNVKHNKLSKRIIPINKGLGARDWIGSDKIYRIWGQEPELVFTEFVTLDSFVQSNALSSIDFIKIDVDGFDLEVLWGADELLKKFNPAVLVELNHALGTRGYTTSQAFQWMMDHGYDNVCVYDHDNYIFTKSDPSSIRADFLNLSIQKVNPPRETKVRISAKYRDFFSLEISPHESAAKVESIFHSNEAAWNYVATWSVPIDFDGPIEFTFDVIRGSLGIFATDASASKQLTREFIFEIGNDQILTLEQVPPGTTQFIFRKTNEIPLSFQVHSIATGLIGEIENNNE